MKRCLLQNKTLEVFEINLNELGSIKEIELSEIVTKKRLDRKGVSFISTGGLLRYLDDTKKAKEAKELKMKEEEASNQAQAELKASGVQANKEIDVVNQEVKEPAIQSS